MEFLKFPLYRLIFDLPLGFSVFFVICIIIGCDEIEKCMKICIDIKPDSSLGVVIYTSVLIVAGEFLAMAGESVVDLFFEFNPVANKVFMEKVSPINVRNNEQRDDENYIRYREFVEVLGEATGETSEIHFLWSRTFGGFGILFLFLSFSYVALFCSGTCPLHLLICYIFFCVVFVAIIFMIISFIMKTNITKGVFLLLVLLLITVVPVTLFLDLSTSDILKLFLTSLPLLLLSILSFLWSVKYRTFSNRINRVIIDIESTTNKNENVNNSSSDN